MDAIALRPLRGGDRIPVLQVFAGLSTRSRYLRFLGAKPRLNERDLELLVDVGRSGREAVVAVDVEAGRSIGIARFVRDRDAPEAEIAFEVVDEWHGRGIGRRLAHELARLARSQGILRLRASVDRSNAPALAVVRGLGEVLATRSEGSVVKLVVRLADSDEWGDDLARSGHDLTRLGGSRVGSHPPRRTISSHHSSRPKMPA